jgi:predicted MFS family arabinose efflux permease
MATKASSSTRHGWIVVAAGVVSIAVHTAIGYSSTLFLVAIAENTGWTRSVVSASLSLYSLGSGLWVPIVGVLVQAWGPRRLLPLAALVLVVGLLAVSGTTSPISLALIMLLPVAIGSVGIGGLTNYTAIQSWFLERRGTALALAAVGSSIGVLLMPSLQSTISSLGWRGGYRAMAVTVLFLAPLHLLVQRGPSEHAAGGTDESMVENPSLSLGAIIRNRGFWLIFLGIWASAFSGNLIMFHHVAYLTDHGLSSTSIATTLEVIGLAGLLGRIGFGWLSDRFGTTSAFALVTLFMMVGIGFLMLAGQTESVPLLYLFGFWFGSSLGVAAILFTRVTADSFGSHNFGKVMGLAYAGGSIGVASGPTFAGAAFDATGSYLSSFVVAEICLIFSFVCVWLLRQTVGQKQHRSF